MLGSRACRVRRMLPGAPSPPRRSRSPERTQGPVSITIVHTADWQLGKPFAGVEDPEKRVHLQKERLDVIGRIGRVARARGARLVVVSGDVFDSPSVTRPTVSKAFSEIGRLEIPVVAIPGNHDHGGAGSIWEQEFFRREQETLAPNFRLLLEPTPVELDDLVLLPAPLLRRRDLQDATAWIRDAAHSLESHGSKPRIVVAHGSVQGFAGDMMDEDDSGAGMPNLIDLSLLPMEELDYIALGDWHGTKECLPKAWYSGTPEQDRFARGDDYSAGNVLAVTVARGAAPVVTRMRTGTIGWHELSHRFSGDDSLALLEREMTQRLGTRALRDVLRLELSGSLGLAAMSRLEQLLESWTSRLLRLKLVNGSTVEPSPEEIQQLVNSGGDPLIASVARELQFRATSAGEDGEIARLALRELFDLRRGAGRGA